MHKIYHTIVLFLIFHFYLIDLKYLVSVLLKYAYFLSGGDDRRVLLWNLDKTLYRKEEPIVMKGQHRSNIFCTVFDGDNRHLFSAGKMHAVILIS